MNQRYPFVNPPLPYAYDALEPFIDEKTMGLHHDAHLQTYVDNLNEIISRYPHLQSWSLTELLERNGELPWEVRQSIINNAGGVYNHIMFFNGMRPAEDAKQTTKKESFTGEMANRFGSLDAFQQQFKKAAMSVFGSGSTWLVRDKNGTLQIVTTPNQDNPLMMGLQPVVILDVWEHAYYLKHYNKRGDYIEDWFKVAVLPLVP